MPKIEPKILTQDERLPFVEVGLQPPVIHPDQPGLLLQERMKAYGVTDVSMAIIDGDTIIPKTVHLETSKEPEATPETLFQAGSISKLVNAIIALKLVEDGKLSLDEPVNDQLIGWKIPENEYTQVEKVTLRHLLSHTAGLNLHGFPGYSSSIEGPLPTNEAILRGGAHLMKLESLPSEQEIREQHLGHHYIFVEEKPEAKLFYIDVDDTPHEVSVADINKLTSFIPKLFQEHAATAQQKLVLSSDQIQDLIDRGECTPPQPGTATTPGVKPIQTPGTEFRYSGGGTQIVQQLIVEAFGGKKTYAEIAKELVLDPLGMSSSSFAIKRPEDTHSSPMAHGHMEDGRVVEGEWHLHPESAAAGLWTTPTDLAKLVMGIQNNSILSAETTEEMLTPQHNSPVGLGPFLNPEAHEFSHTAGTFGFCGSLVGFSQCIKKGAIILTNSNNGGLLMQEIHRSIARAYDWPKNYSGQSIVRKPIEQAIIQPLIGEYGAHVRDGDIALSLVQKDDHFFLKCPFPHAKAEPKEFELIQGEDNSFYCLMPHGPEPIHLINDNQFKLFKFIVTRTNSEQLSVKDDSSPSALQQELKTRLSEIKADEGETDADEVQHRGPQ